MRTVHDTRKSLNIHKMDKKELRDLYGKFADHIETLEEKRALVKERETQAREERRKKYQRTAASTGKSETNTQGKGGLDAFVTRLRIYFSALFSGIIDLSGKNLGMPFIQFVRRQLVPVLKEADMFVGAIIHPVGKNQHIIAEKEEKLQAALADTFALELLERYEIVYDESMYTDFLRDTADGAPIETKSYLIKELFRSIYILRKHKTAIVNAAKQGLAVYAELEEVEAPIINERLSRIERALALLYNKFYPMLLVAVRHIEGVRFEDPSEELARYLEISSQDELGFYTGEKMKIDAKKEQELAAEKEKEKRVNKEKRIDAHIVKGLSLIDSLMTYEKEANGIERDTHPLFYVKEDDKVYRIKLLLDFFDREYAIVLSTNKVKYNVTYNRAEKTDYFAQFAKALSQEDGVHKRINEYIEVIKEIIQINDSDLIYETKRKLLDTKEVNRSKFAKILHTKLEHFLLDLKGVLTTLLRNKAMFRNAVVNGDERIYFDPSLYGKRRMNGRTVHQALGEVYLFIVGFHHLVTQGELGGSGLLIEEGSDPLYAEAVAKAKEHASEKEHARNKADAKAEAEEEEHSISVNKGENAKEEKEEPVSEDMPVAEALQEAESFFLAGSPGEGKRLARYVLRNKKSALADMKKALRIMLTAYNNAKRYEETQAVFLEFQSVGNDDKECIARYKTAQTMIGKMERDEIVKRVRHAVGGIQEGLGEILLHVAEGDRMRLIALVKNQGSRLVTNPKTDAETGTRWKRLLDAFDTLEPHVSPIEPIELPELVTILGWVRRPLMERIPAKESESVTSLLQRVSEYLDRAILPGMRYDFEKVDVEKLRSLLVDCQKCATALANLTKRLPKETA